MADRDVMDRAQVAEYLGCSPDTVDTLDLPSHLVGPRLRRYLRAEVLAWVARQPGSRAELVA